MQTKRITLLLLFFLAVQFNLFSTNKKVNKELDNWNTKVIHIDKSIGIGPVNRYVKTIKTTRFSINEKTDKRILYLITDNHYGYSKVYLNGELLGTIGSIKNIKDNTALESSSLMILDVKKLEKSINKLKIENYSTVASTNNMSHKISSYITVPMSRSIQNRIKEVLPFAFTLLTLLVLILYIVSKSKAQKEYGYYYVQSLILFIIYFILSGLNGDGLITNSLLKFSRSFYVFTWLIFIRYYIVKSEIWDFKKVSIVGFILITSVLSVSIISQYNFLFPNLEIIDSILIIFINTLFLRLILKNRKENESVFRVGIIISLALQAGDLISIIVFKRSTFGLFQTGAISAVLTYNLIFTKEHISKAQMAEEYSNKLLETVEKLKKDISKRDKDISDLKSENEEVIREKSIFFTTLNNNLRTPLNSIIGYSENLYSATSLDEVHETVNDLIIESDKIFQAINNVMDFSTRNFASSDLLLKDFRMKEIYENSVFESSILTSFSKNINYTALGDCDKVIIYGNPIIYKQILTNILHFLIELYPKTIDYTIYDFGINKNNMNLGVKITAKDLENTQLSLISSIANYRDVFTKYIKLYNISFAEEMSEDKYSIEMKFQCGLSHNKIKEVGKNIDSSLILERVLRVMVVEDYKPNLNIVKMHLQKMGCDVYTATNGEEAVELFKRETIDVILMDIKMPIMDGWEATELIRSTKEGLNTFIIGLTASSQDLDIRHCFESGMDDVQVKPIRKKQLYNKLNSLEKLKPVTFPTIGSLRAELCVSKIETETLYSTSVNQIEKQLEVLEVLLSANDNQGIEKEMPAILHAALNINAFYFSRILRNFHASYKDGDKKRAKKLILELKNIIEEAKEVYANLFRD